MLTGRVYFESARFLFPGIHENWAPPASLVISGKDCHTCAQYFFGEIAMSMNVSLPPELEARVRQRVESGMYGSASEVIREALRLFEAYEQVKTAKLDSLRQDIAKGLSDAKNGRAKEIDFASLKLQGRQLLQTRKTAA